MRRFGLAVVLAAACIAAACSSKSSAPAAAPPAEKTWDQCQGSDQALVRRAILAVDGRGPWGQAEVSAYVDLLVALRALGYAEKDARAALVNALARDDAYLSHWGDFLTDSLLVTRRVNAAYLGGAAAMCFGPIAAPSDAGLATWVRDNGPAAHNPEYASFTIARLITSSLVLDDLSPVYRAGIFAILAARLQGMNVTGDALERARRENFASTFGQIYLHRDTTCLRCHNSAGSVTYGSDPQTNRFWALPFNLEEPLFGTPDASGDRNQYLAVFRYDGVATTTSEGPWGWNATICGTSAPPVTDDPLGVDAHFASVHASPDTPNAGKRASVWNVEYALRRGVDTLAKNGLVPDPSDPTKLADPDQAFAYLVAMNVAEKVWTATVGSPLTIANYFPRSAATRDTLRSLADTLATSHFSLRALLSAIVAHPAFNLAPPSAQCGPGPYAVPRLFTPWTIAESDPTKQQNSPADGVHPRPPRTLLRSLHTAMGWPALEDFPPPEPKDTNHVGDFESSIGVFLSNIEQGFTGMHFQARLSWEDAYGRCDYHHPDFVSSLLDRATSAQANAGDVVSALKDRLIGEPAIDDAEKQALAQLLGTSLDDTNVAALEPRFRLVCGAYVSSPQFLLGGSSVADASDAPKLTDPEHDYATTCASIATRLTKVDPSVTIDCASHKLTAVKRLRRGNSFRTRRGTKYTRRPT